MGDRNRITKDWIDPDFQHVLWASDNGGLRHNLSPAFTRPAYACTKASVGGISNGVQNLRRANKASNI